MFHRKAKKAEVPEKHATPADVSAVIERRATAIENAMKIIQEGITIAHERRSLSAYEINALDLIVTGTAETVAELREVATVIRQLAV